MFFIDILLVLFTLYIVVKGLYTRTYKQLKSLLAISLGVASTIVIFWFENLSKIIVKPIFVIIDEKLFDKLPIKYARFYSGFSFVTIPLIVFLGFLIVSSIVYWLILSIFIKKKSYEKLFVFERPKVNFSLKLFLSLSKALLLVFIAIQVLLMTRLINYPSITFSKDTSWILDFFGKEPKYDILAKIFERIMQYIPARWVLGGIV